MFGHMCKYALKSLLRTKEVVFWTLAFPFALTTFMFMAFSNLFETTEMFHAVPVAIVEEKENPAMLEMIKELSSDGEDSVLKVTKTDEQKAEQMLAEEEIEGIIYIDSQMTLKVAGNGMEETLLQMVLDQILQYQKTIEDVMQEHPEKMNEAITQLASQVDYCVEKKTTEGNQDNIVNYFYAIFAMTCLFASFAACFRVIMIQANASALRQRRSVGPIHKMKIIITEFCVTLLFQYAIVMLLFIFMKVILQINLGDKTLAICILLLMGNAIGVMMGILIGSLPRLSEGAKVGILTCVSLLLSALSDLMVSGIKNWLEHHIPIVNDLNPAALICDSFYALNVYETYDRFVENMLMLGGEVVVLGIVCYFFVRRSRYASL